MILFLFFCFCFFVFFLHSEIPPSIVHSGFNETLPNLEEIRPRSLSLVSLREQLRLPTTWSRKIARYLSTHVLTPFRNVRGIPMKELSCRMFWGAVERDPLDFIESINTLSTEYLVQYLPQRFFHYLFFSHFPMKYCFLAVIYGGVIGFVPSCNLAK